MKIFKYLVYSEYNVYYYILKQKIQKIMVNP